jgi:farnesyl diphosphate synthase
MLHIIEGSPTVLSIIILSNQKAHYGRKDKTSESKIKEIFNSDEVNLKQRYEEHEEESFAKLNGLIEQIDESLGLKKDLFRAFLAKIYRRTK